MPPLFSIIAVHYQGAIPHEIFCRGIASIEGQTFRDFELLAFHDGPFLDPDPEPGGWPCDIYPTDRRYDDWGHTLRHTGMHMATGAYIVHFNADNVLYPNALERIAQEIRRPPIAPIAPIPGVGRAPAEYDRNEIIVFPIKAFGLRRVFGWFTEQWPRGESNFCEIMTGNPPQFGNIDAMQLVMRRDLWIAEGGWSDKSKNGDGRMYPKFCEKYGYRTVGEILGEHH